MKNAEKGIKAKYIFTSENAGVVGLVSFTEYGGMRLLNVKKVNDYPAIVDAGKFLAVPERRAVVFGKDFSGLSLFSEKNFKLKEKKLFKSGSFSAGGLVDVDIDGMNDLLLFNNARQTLLYFLNVTNAFQFTREEELAGEIRQFKINDFDGDRVRDFSFLLGDSLYIYIVNSNPKNIKHFSLFVNGCVDYKFLRINDDSKRDVLAVDSTGNLSAYYNLGKSKFSSPSLLTKIEGTEALATVWDVDRRKLIILSDKGHFSTLKKTDKIDTTKNILLSGNDFKTPKIVENKKEYSAYWIDGQSFRLNSISVSKKSGEITGEDFPLPFIPDDFDIVNSSGSPAYLIEKYQSEGFTYLLKGKGNREFLFSGGNKINVNGMLFVERIPDSLQIFELKKTKESFAFDTLKLDPAPLALLASQKNNFVYLSKNNQLVFSHTEKRRSVSDTAYNIDKKLSLFELSFNYDLYPAVLGKKGSRLTLFLKDSSKVFYSSRNFNKANIIPRLVKLGEKNFFIVYDKNYGAFYKAEIKPGKSFLRFRLLFKVAGIKNFSAAEIGGKSFIIYFNKRLNSLTFKEIL